MIKPFKIDRVEELPNNLVKIYFTAYRTYWDTTIERGVTQTIVDTIVNDKNNDYDNIVYTYLKERGLLS